jgi:hypothetical protein
VHHYQNKECGFDGAKERREFIDRQEPDSVVDVSIFLFQYLRDLKGGNQNARSKAWAP